MRTILRAYDAAVMALAIIAGVMLAGVFVFIIYDVVLRNFLISPPAWTVPSIEYGLLYITMFSAPYLVRTRGHVLVEALRQVLPERPRRVLEKIVYVVCLAVCAVLAWFAFELWLDAYISGEFDGRAIEVPHTVRYAPMVIGFVMMGCEFVRNLLGAGSLYQERIGRREGV